MQNKIKELLGSVRFWGVSFIAALAIVKGTVDTGFDINMVIDTLQIWVGAVVGLGTLDSVATKFGISFVPTTTKKTTKK